MPADNISNFNIIAADILTPPNELKKKFPVNETLEKNIMNSRSIVQNILDGKDKRIFGVIGPCSIHDTLAAREYAMKLKQLADRVKESIYIVMRVYFEKPRTTVGWKGLINDPFLDGSFRIQEGLEIGRKLLIDLVEMGLPVGTEALDPISPQYMQDLITWSAIGARTTESQTHREMASGLSGAVGFKNGTDGNLTVAMNALKSVSQPHSFLGINQKGQVSTIKTKGNPYGHIVLRGGGGHANYDHVNVLNCENVLKDAGVTPNIIIDCSHDNSQKNHNNQPLVLEDITSQIISGNQSIKGFMLESNLLGGNQKMAESSKDLQYGVSITDKCIDWETTERCLLETHHKLNETLKNR